MRNRMEKMKNFKKDGSIFLKSNLKKKNFFALNKID